MKHLIAIATIAIAGVAHAQWKCVGPDGKVAFQQTPCAKNEQQQALDIRVSQPSQPAAPPATGARVVTADDRVLAMYARERSLTETTRQIGQLEHRIAIRGQLMEADLEALRARKSRAKNNLAGATWEQSISTEMEAVMTKHRTMNDVDMERLKRLRAELAELQAKAPAR